MKLAVIEQIGPTSKIYEELRTTFVAEFIGMSNFLRGRLGSVTDGTAQIALRDGSTIRARRRPDGPSNGEVLVMVRPEHVAVERDGAGGKNELRATIREVVYLGTYIRYVAELPAGDLVTVEEQNLPGAARAAVGESLRLRVAPEHCLILDRAR